MFRERSLLVPHPDSTSVRLQILRAFYAFPELEPGLGNYAWQLRLTSTGGAYSIIVTKATIILIWDGEQQEEEGKRLAECATLYPIQEFMCYLRYHVCRLGESFRL